MKIFQQKIRKKIFSALVFAVAVLSFFLENSFAATATSSGVGRTRSCSGTGTPDGLDFDPTTGGKDVEFSLSNPVCQTVILTSYLAVKIAIANMNRVCVSGSVLPRAIPSPLLDSIDLVKAGIKARQSPGCAVAVATASASFATMLSELAVIYGIAEHVYQSSSVCGAEWMDPNPKSYNYSTPNKKQEVELAIQGYIRDDTTQLTLDNQTYREWYYGGIEVSDNPDNSDETCRDPTASSERDYEKYPAQKYYLKGLQSGNYNCKRYFLPSGSNDPYTGTTATTGRIDDFQRAYNCCQRRAQNYICIKYGDYVNLAHAPNAGTSISDISPYNFCRAGSLCKIKGITFSTKSLDNGRLICAETYSLCPYNFTIGGGARYASSGYGGGGSEYCDYYQDGTWSDNSKRWTIITQDDIDAGDCSSKSEIRNQDCSYNDKAGKCRNYCQYLNHCTIPSGTTYQYQSGLGSPYFSDACMNFVGDSQNQTAYGGTKILGSQKHFSLPIAQCTKETLENLFYNLAGHSKCLSTNEYPSADGTCPSGNYIQDGSFTYKKGNTVKDVSFFSMMQNMMQDVVKLTITMSIMFYGMNILLGKNDIRNKKDILTYIFKIAMVLYFATGDAWQNNFFKAVYGASSEFSRMVFRIGMDQQELKRDGCQFGIITVSEGVFYDTGKNYPSGKEYLALWDTLDCKLMRYLGYGPEVSTANIFSLIFAGYFTGAVGIYFSMAVMFLGFFFLAVVVRAIHVFLASCMSIIIFVFVSPMVIPCVLFKKTESIFKNWLSNLIIFCFQPMILFAYIAILCVVIDKTLIGSATFVGTAPAKTISCQSICKNSDGTIAAYVDGVAPACDETGQTKVDPMEDSVACLIGINSFGKMPGLDLIGVSIPILVNVFTGDVKSKIITLLRGALVMYLLYKFLDEIPGIVTQIIGGNDLGLKTFKGSLGALVAMQKRAKRAVNKLAKGAGSRAKEIARDSADRGTSVGEAKGKGADHANRDGGNDDADNVSSGGGNDGADNTNSQN